MLFMATHLSTQGLRALSLLPLLNLGGRDRVLGLCISSSPGQGLSGRMGRDLALSGTVSSCLLTLRQTVVNSLKVKEVGAFASKHSRVEREALGLSSVQVLSLQLPLPAENSSCCPGSFYSAM